MYKPSEIAVDRAILNTLDPRVSNPELSKQVMPLDDDVRLFLSGHIASVLNREDLKPSSAGWYLKDTLDLPFPQMAAELSTRLHGLMQASPSITPGDLIFVDFRFQSEKYLALLKMDYRDTYQHRVGGDTNSILQYRVSLPGRTQSIKEAVILEHGTLWLRVLEYPVEIQGVRENYLSELFLECKAGPSSKEQYAAVKNALGRVLKHYYAGDATMRLRAALELADGVQIDGGFDLEDYASELFGAATGVQDAFLEAVERCGISEKGLQFSGKTLEAIGKPQTIKTDAGIEVKLPLHLCTDPDYIEITTDARGKQQILIKNINLIK